METPPGLRTFALFFRPVVEPAVFIQPVLQPAVFTQPVLQPAVFTQPVLQPVVFTRPVLQPVVFTRPVLQPVVELAVKCKHRVHRFAGVTAGLVDSNRFMTQSPAG